MSIKVDKPQAPRAAATPQYDVVVVGAGPYGLSAAAHLQEQGVKTAIFGKPMGFWRDHTPEGMRMRSHWWATNLSDPHHHYGMVEYAQQKGAFEQDPFWCDTFIDYGLWFQKQVVPNVDETLVKTVRCNGNVFEVLLADQRIIQASAVIMAIGLAPYADRLGGYPDVSPELISHTVDHNRLNTFAGKRVVLLGGGQSAFQTAALLHEAGTASVEIVMRRPIRWVPEQNPRLPAFLRQMRAPKAQLGVGWSNVILERFPYLFHKLPQEAKDKFLATRHLPAASPWLRERIVGKVLVHEQVQLQDVQEDHQELKLRLSNGHSIAADHLMLATGYKSDVKHLPLLDTSIQETIQSYLGYPVLNDYFESSVPGLYFLGFSSQRSLGPYYRFVAGAGAAAARVASIVAVRKY